MAALIRQNKNPKVDKIAVVGMEKVPYEFILGPQVGKAVQNLHEQNGIEFHLGTVVEKLTGNSEGRIEKAYLKSGAILDADLVIVGVGVAPETKYLHDYKEFLDRDGAITVDEFLRARKLGSDGNRPYAVGDLARFPYLLSSLREDVRIEHWAVAQQQGRVAALNMLGKNVPFTDVPFFWTKQYALSLRYCGHAEKFDNVIIEGELDKLTFIAVYTRGEEALAVLTANKDPEASAAIELFQLRKMPPTSELKKRLQFY